MKRIYPSGAENAFADPEASYRRGYHQAAAKMFENVQVYLPPDTRSAYAKWLVDLKAWRYELPKRARKSVNT